MNYRLDLHTHSIASSDGGLRMTDYADMISRGGLDFVAVTDHDRIDFAVEAKRALGDNIIIGEEISTSEGELIGLYLTQAILPGKTARETAEAIHAQGGLVYVPHPFETVRKGMAEAALYKISDLADIIEIYNGRAFFQNRGHLSEQWAQLHHCRMAASSDAHGPHGWGRTYSSIARPATAKSLVASLGTAQYSREQVGVRGLLYPKLNRLRKRLQP